MTGTPTIPELLQLALEHHRGGRLAQAEALYRQVLALGPANPQALHWLGVLAYQLGRHEAAADLIGRAVAASPGVGDFHDNLGIVLHAMGQLDKAIACYRKAIELNPKDAQAYYNIGNALQQQGRDEQAIASYQRAIQIKPDYAIAYTNLGNAFELQARLEDAIACYRKAIELKGDYAGVYNNLGRALQTPARRQEGIACYRKALQIKADYADAHSNLLLSLHYTLGDDAPAMFAEHQGWASCHAEPLRPLWPAHANNRAPDRPLRVGYVSGDFRHHPVGFFIQPLLESHDRSRFTIACYADVARSDHLTDRFRRCADQWRTIVGVANDQVAQMVQADGIDILVDLSGHTAGNRMLLFARKPAPVQATYLGYPNTTGMSAMDYRLTDACCDPPGSTERYHSEELIRLPGCFLCYRPHPDSPAVADPPALKSGYITFGSFNNLGKVTAEMLKLWAELLRAVPDSRLLLKAKALADESVRSDVRRMFAAEGIAWSRLELLAQKAQYARHLETYAGVDIALDTFPYCGTTTTCEALWMGVPVVTLCGRAHVSRVGMSLLSAAGCADLVAQSPQQYLAIATGLAQEPLALADRRREMRQRLGRSPLCDERRLAQSVEQAYLAMWRRWCAGP